jgi:hypothetical protein
MRGGSVMARIKLSVIEPGIGLAQALREMQASGNSAVVVQVGDKNRIMALGDLLVGLRSAPAEDVAWCTQQVYSKPAWFEGLVDEYIPTAVRTDHFFTTRGAGADSYLLSSSRANLYGTVVSVSDGIALVDTSTPDVARRLVLRVTLCTCSVDGSHVFLPSEIRKAGQCNYQDGGTLTCK